MLVYRVEKDGDDEYAIEYLPEPDWSEIAEDYNNEISPLKKQLVKLYSLIRSQENHYQYHTPPAFGDPDYARKSGLVDGFLVAVSFQMYTSKEGWIVIKNETGKRTLMLIQKPTKTQAYEEARKNNANMIKEFLG